MVSLRAWNSSSVVLLFLSVNLLAAWINHIDDTDETYGYWEPLHYLVHSKGMQTWEYSPHYALRTYCFIVPLLPIAKLLAAVSVPKIYQFYILRATIGLFYAVAEANLTVALKRLAGVEVSVVFAFLLLLSPGVFFSSTSYLPSAVAGSLLMFSYSSWLLDKFLLAIVFGSAAVLLTGWPFVGVLFLPIGIHMLAAVFMKEYSEAKKDRSPSIVRAVASVGLFCLHGLLIALLTMVLGTLVDYVLYRKW